MSDVAVHPDQLEQYRYYLRLELDPRLHGKLDVSGVANTEMARINTAFD